MNRSRWWRAGGACSQRPCIQNTQERGPRAPSCRRLRTPCSRQSRVRPETSGPMYALKPPVPRALQPRPYRGKTEGRERELIQTCLTYSGRPRCAVAVDLEFLPLLTLKLPPPFVREQRGGLAADCGTAWRGDSGTSPLAIHGQRRPLQKTAICPGSVLAGGA